MSRNALSKFGEPESAKAASVKIENAEKPVGCQVAVIIPAYNSMRYLPEALSSVLAQSYQDFEVIIVDDGSQDEIKDWYAQLSDAVRQQVTLFSQPNQGVAYARNTGIAQTSSPYVAFLDSDDIWLPHKLAQQVQYLEANPTVSLVCSGAAVVDPQGQLMGRIYPGQLDPQPWAQLVVSNVIPTPSVVLARRECLEAVGGFDLDLISYVEDKDLWIRIARSHKMASLPGIMIHKRRHATNLSKKWKSMELASYQVLEKAFANPPEEITQNQLQRLKRKSYAKTNLGLAWKPVQTDAVDVKAAISYLLKVLSYQPTLIVTKEVLKLGCVILLLSLLGADRYRWLLTQAAGMRYRFSERERTVAISARAEESGSSSL
ncbi:MAG: glycosyltransferase family A protein [Phormidesmis sp.]